MPLRIPEFAVRIKTSLGNFCGRAVETVMDLSDRLLERIPQEWRRFVLPAAVGVLALLLLVFIAVLLPERGAGQGEASPGYNTPVRELIPPDDLFLPNEPDFMPGVMPGRERRSEWTAEDVEPFWQDPLENGEEPWRNRIEKTIDEIMESVP